MCGIAGAVGLRPDARPDPARVEAMSCRIAHRGPDGLGLWVAPSGRACLAHRRLSVIDLVTGGQPMVGRDDAMGLVFNGEIYNYRELRADLRRDGVPLHTESDTEALLRLLERDWTGAIEPLRGMFAFCAWDDRAGRLLLARDRLGKKPMYWVVEDGVLYFGSSLRALRETASRPWTISPAALDAYLTLGYVPAPQTIYEGVHKLPAASLLTVEQGEPRVASYWSLAEADAPFEGSEDDALDQLDALLRESVALRLRSDVPLGVFLSGGIDSSLIAAIAMEQAGAPVDTFTIGMDVAGFDESAAATAVAKHLGTRHHVFPAKPDLLATLPTMVWHYGEPFADNSALATWMLAEASRPHVTVALGGDGGDEGFAGYDWYRTAARLQRMTRVVPAPAFALAGRAWEGLSAAAPLARSPRAGQVRRGLAMLGTPAGARRFAALRVQLGAADADDLYAGALREERARHGAAAQQRLAQLFERSEGSALRRMRCVDIATYLADMLNPKVDVATMAHGLEARAPLLDQEVVRFALTLPDAMVTDGQRGKLILRRLLARYVPPALFERPKQGFDLPLSRWFSGAVEPRIRQLPRSERLMAGGWLRPEGVARLVEEHTSGRRDHGQRLFTLLVLDEWLGVA